MSKKCVCGREMTLREWDNTWVCTRCGRKKPVEQPETYTVFECYKCGSQLFVLEDDNFPQKLEQIAGKCCPECGEQDEGLWRLLGRSDRFEGEIIREWED